MSVNAGRFTGLNAAPPNSSVAVYTHGTKTLASLYTDKSSGTAAANPVPVDSFGNFSFFAVPGDVDLALPVGPELGPWGIETITVTVPADPTEAWPG
jgi:hypothetical protein